MIDPQHFFEEMRAKGIGPFVGVPCSLIKSLTAYAVDHPSEVEYINPVHESHAMGFAAGSFLPTGTLPMAFLQNSGFGNIVNPLTSLHQIYAIPALLLVTWRAEGGYGTDAPEHWIVGRDMEEYFKTFRLPYRILSEQTWKEDMAAMSEESLRTKMPTVLCVRKGMFSPYTPKQQPGAEYSMRSQDAIALIKDALQNAVFLSTTGMISRESFTAKDTPDFYMMGSMGLLSAIAAGCASHTEKRVVVLDGDGAVMMHMGMLPFIGHKKYENLLHIVIDNEAYASTDGQPTVSGAVDFAMLGKACGYPISLSVRTEQELRTALKNMQPLRGPVLLHIKVRSGSDHHIGRVSDRYTCPEVAERFRKNFE